jgi:hypothetical protein
MPAARSRNVRREGIVRAVERGASAAGGVVLLGEPLDSHQAEATGASHWQRGASGWGHRRLVLGTRGDLLRASAEAGPGVTLAKLRDAVKEGYPGCCPLDDPADGPRPGPVAQNAG